VLLVFKINIFSSLFLNLVQAWKWAQFKEKLTCHPPSCKQAPYTYPGRNEPPVTHTEKLPWLLIPVPSQGRLAHRQVLKQVPQVPGYFSQISGK